MSSIILSEAKCKSGNDQTTSSLTKNIVISTPERKNEFSKRKVDAFRIINDDSKMQSVYDRSKSILEKAASKYSTNSGKSWSSIFKNRKFDKDYLQPEIDLDIEERKL